MSASIHAINAGLVVCHRHVQHSTRCFSLLGLIRLSGFDVVLSLVPGYLFFCCFCPLDVSVFEHVLLFSRLRDYTLRGESVNFNLVVAVCPGCCRCFLLLCIWFYVIDLVDNWRMEYGMSTLFERLKLGRCHPCFSFMSGIFEYCLSGVIAFLVGFLTALCSWAFCGLLAF